MGSAIVAALTVATAALASICLALLIKPEGFGADNTLTLVSTLMTGAFGADLVGSAANSDVDGEGAVGLFPLTITLASLTVAVVLFLRLTSRYRDGLVAVADAIRTAVITAIPLVLIAAVFRSDNDTLGSGLSDFEAGGKDELVTFGASVAGSLLMPVVLVAAVLFLACLARKSWWDGRMAQLAEWASAPLSGLAALVLLLPMCGVIAVTVTLLFGEGADTENFSSDEWMTFAGVAIALLGNFGLVFNALGVGAPAGADMKTEATSGVESFSNSMGEMHRLAWFAGEGDEPGLWVAVLILPLWLLCGAFVVARRSTSKSVVTRNLLMWSATLVVAVPLLCRLASLHAQIAFASTSSDSDAFGLLGVDEGSIEAFVGPDGFQTTAFIVLSSLFAAVVVATMAGALDLRTVSTRVAAAARDLQASPSAGVSRRTELVDTSDVTDSPHGRA